ncbi:MAG TPA: hypothetical protein VGC05_12425, partial [Mycobacterium sp.]
AIDQPYTIAAAGGGAAPASFGVPTGLSASPGLAGTAGIQPQLNVEGLAEWAQGLSGADLVAAGIA